MGSGYLFEGDTKMTQTSDIDQARLLFGQGKRDEARNVLVKAVHSDPRNFDAWFGLSFCIDDPGQKQDCLERVLRLAPEHQKAKLSLQKLLIGEDNLPDIPQDMAPEVETMMPAPHIESEAREQGVKEKPPVKNADDELIHAIEDVEQKGQPAKKAGESTYKQALRFRKIGIISSSFLIIITILYLILHELSITVYRSSNITLPLMIVFLVISTLALIYLKKLADRWEKFGQGAKAEELVGEILKNLSADYMVLNDIQLGYGNIDHFVIGKNGCMYMIETKSHKGKVTVENDQIRINNKRPEKDFLKQCLRNAYDVRDEIASILGVSLTVTPLLVFTAAFVPYKANIKNIFIMNKKTLLKFILSGKEQPNSSKIWEKRGMIQEFLYRPRW